MKVPLDGSPLESFEVRVDFGSAVSSDTQGRSLFVFERYLREELKVPAVVFKQTMADDLKRRRDMTDEDRGRL